MACTANSGASLQEQENLGGVNTADPWFCSLAMPRAILERTAAMSWLSTFCAASLNLPNHAGARPRTRASESRS